MKKILLIIILIIVATALCYYFMGKQRGSGEEMAAAYCLEQGGTTEVFVFKSGKDAYCVFDDDSLCWQGDFFEKSCQKGQLKINVLAEGTGNPAEEADTLTVHYMGTLLDGTQFDSSLDKGEPFSFVLGEGGVIAGWEQGVSGMKVGEKRELIIGPELAYGEAGFGEVISPNATLVFEVELLELKPITRIPGA